MLVTVMLTSMLEEFEHIDKKIEVRQIPMMLEETIPAESCWSDAYSDILQNSESDWMEYTLLEFDGEIPLLVAIGDCEAAGVSIFSYCDGKIEETELNRLEFSYILLP